MYPPASATFTCAARAALARIERTGGCGLFRQKGISSRLTQQQVADPLACRRSSGRRAVRRARRPGCPALPASHRGPCAAVARCCWPRWLPGRPASHGESGRRPATPGNRFAAACGSAAMLRALPPCFSPARLAAQISSIMNQVTVLAVALQHEIFGSWTGAERDIHCCSDRPPPLLGRGGLGKGGGFEAGESA